MKKLFKNQIVMMTFNEAAPDRARVSDDVCLQVEVADRSWSRTIGLLGRAGLDDGHAMLIKQCRSIHTFFMQFTIDVAFVDDQLCVVDYVENLPPGRLFICRERGGKHVFEFKGGCIEKYHIEKGSRFTAGHPA